MNNIWKDIDELKEHFERFTQLGLRKTLKNYKLTYGEIEISKWNSLMGYYKSIYSNNYVCIEEYLNKKTEKKSFKNKKKKLRKEKKEENIKKYKDYLKSDIWNNKRRIFIKKYKNQCQCCKLEFLDKDLNLHHHTYKRTRNEKDEDLVLVCTNCHSNIHFKNGKKIQLNEFALRNRFDEISYSNKILI